MIRMKQILSETHQEENYRKLNSKQKHRIIDAVNKFNKFDQHIYRQKDVKEIVEAIKIISEYAGKLALDETGDWFDGVTVKKDVKDINDSVALFEKTAKEVGTLQHRLEAMYENIGGKLSRYYEIADVDRTIPIAPKNANTSPQASTSHVNEAVNVNYWKGYHERSTKITGGNKVASAVENEVRDWNKNNTDGPSNNISSNGEKKVMNLAHDFFKSAGWISSDIIQAMITQEG